MFSAPAAYSFCGFYVARGDAKIFNKASKVVMVRDGTRTVLTMSNDFKGNPKEFAIVVPVPTFLDKGQIHIGEQAVIDHLDAYSAPRLVEYFDQDPCLRAEYKMDAVGLMAKNSAPAAARELDRARALGVAIEAKYTVGEYDIVILSATQSGGLEIWLRENGYTIPRGAASVLAGYIKQNVRFFVAKVNLTEQAKLGFSYLRPIQVAFESPKFMLPIRLGMINADGAQELFVFALTKDGRVETTNYRTVRLPEGMDVPEYVKESFPEFYRAMFSEQVRKERGEAVFLEYAWNMGWCDPCAADPLTPDELRGLGVWWVADPRRRFQRGGRPAAGLHHAPPRPLRPRALPRGPGLPADRRPDQFPGPVRDPSPVERRLGMRGDRLLSDRAPRPALQGGREPRVAHRMVGRLDPQKDEPDRRLVGAVGQPEMVGPDLDHELTLWRSLVPLCSPAPAPRRAAG